MPQTITADPKVKQCAELCQECHAVCVETVAHCLEQGGKHAEAEHIGLLMDCAQICLVSGDYMFRGSPRHGLTCGVCASVCEDCAQDCERIDPRDQAMKRCAEICRRCAESCREMADHA